MLAGAAPAFARGSGTADVVLTNASVWTLNPRKPFARAVAVSGGTIVFVGSVRGAQEFVGNRTEVLDLRGRMVLPGIHDGHIHPLSGGRSLTAPSLPSGIHPRLYLSRRRRRSSASVRCRIDASFTEE